MAAGVVVAMLGTVGANAVAASPAEHAPVPQSNPSDGTITDEAAAAALAGDYDLTMDEARRRIGRQEKLQKVSDNARRRAPSAGGAFIDHANGGRLIVWLKDVKEKDAVDRSAREQGQEAHVQVRHGRHDRRELEAANQRVIDVVSAEPDEVRLGLGNGIDGLRNVVMITRPSQPSQRQSELLRALKAELGDVVEEEVVDTPAIPFGECTSDIGFSSGTNCNPPLRGGTRMGPGAASNACTAGFVGRHDDGRRFIITAGHCARFNGGTGAAWNTVYADGVGHTFGTMHSWVYGSSGDMGVIAIDPIKLPALTPRPWVNMRASGGAYPSPENESYVISGTGSSSSIPNSGNYLCHTGKTIGTRCGPFSQGGVTKTYSNPDGTTTTVNGLGVVNAVGCVGDSGGPVFVGNLAFGVLSGGHGGDSGFVNGKRCTTGFAYQGITAINNILHVYPMTPSNTPACPPESGGGTQC